MRGERRRFLETLWRGLVPQFVSLSLGRLGTPPQLGDRLV
jgi:hypothetical protein